MNSDGESASIPDTLAAWPLIHTANNDPSRHLGATAAAVCSVDFSNLTRSFGTDGFLRAIKYETVAAVVLQCNNNTATSIAHPKTVSAMASCAYDSKKNKR